MRNINNVNIEIVRGDTLAFRFQLVPSDDSETSYTLSSAYFSVKQNAEDEDYMFQKTLDDGITQADTNIYSVKVAPSDTQDMDVGTYCYDLQIGINGDIKTILIGKFDLKQDITREVS